MNSDQFTVKIRLCPDDETMAAILKLLNLWQDAHPDLMVAMVPAGDRYEYEIIRSGRRMMAHLDEYDRCKAACNAEGGVNG